MMFYKRRPTKKELAETKEKYRTRRVGVLDRSGVAKETARWLVRLRDGSNATISFSRDNLLVFLNGEPIKEVDVRFKDDQYDVLLYFSIGEDNYTIYSDVNVEDKKLPMINYLYVNGIVKNQKTYDKQKDHEEVYGTTQTAMELGYKVRDECRPRLPMDIFLEEDAAMQQCMELDDGK